MIGLRPCSATEVAEELACAIASDALRGSPQLCALLKYIVEATLEGNADQLKGYTIAVEVMNRPPDFDSQANPIVRVQAKRLRDALKLYYSNEGQKSPIVISIGKGGYKAVFQRRYPEDEQQAESQPVVPPAVADGSEKPAFWLRSWQRNVAAGVAALVVLIGAGLWLGLVPMPASLAESRVVVSTAPPRAGTPAAKPRADFRAMRHRPVIQFVVKSEAVPWSFDLGMLVMYTSRFDGVSVAHPDEGNSPVNSGPSSNQHHYTVQISSCGHCATEALLLNVTASRTREIIPTRVIPIGPKGYSQAVVEIARTLGAADGLVLSHMRSIRDLVPESYACVNDAHVYFQSSDMQVRTRVMQCIEEYRASGQEDALMELSVALMALDGAWQQENVAGNIDIATRAASRAVELAPTLARVHHGYGLVLAARGELEEALKATQRAYELNPHDFIVAIGMGTRLIGLNRVREARAFLEPLYRDTPVPSNWLTFNLATAYVIENDLVALDSIVHRLRGTSVAFGHILLVIAESYAEDPAVGRRALATFRQKYMKIANDVPAHIAAFYRNPVVAGKLTIAYSEALRRLEGQQ